MRGNGSYIFAHGGLLEKMGRGGVRSAWAFSWTRSNLAPDQQAPADTTEHISQQGRLRSGNYRKRTTKGKSLTLSGHYRCSKMFLSNPSTHFFVLEETRSCMVK
ncbi:hypothetical protein BaRGS_00038268 [Batillaria attramentaria]|uniref:Uncharacterized protein n=1 Tax=Batillaria attramentaria TaxID=370345 RepID=A0ABD0J644_9CAEN